MELELEPLNLPSDSKRPFVIAGPCSAETEEQVMETAKELAIKGCHMFRAGVWKPRTKPGGFEGHGEPALAWMAEVKKEEDFLLSTRSVVRHVYAPMLNKKGGVISRYDALFMTYCQPIRWDWRLMAAQCYQESTFDPQARSWAGALGLMQIMTET